MPHTISLEFFEDNQDANIGICTDCGEERECCEPDARNYKCESCGAYSVFGLEELLVMGLVT